MAANVSTAELAMAAKKMAKNATKNATATHPPPPPAPNSTLLPFLFFIAFLALLVLVWYRLSFTKLWASSPTLQRISAFFRKWLPSTGAPAGAPAGSPAGAPWGAPASDSDGLLPMNDVDYASFLVADALQGQIRDQYPDTQQQRDLYLRHVKIKPLFTAAIAALIVLTFVETPLWCKGKWPTPCNAPKGGDLYLSGVQYLPRMVGYLVEAGCIGMLSVDVLYKFRIYGRHILFKTKVIGVLLLLEVADLLFTMVMNQHSVRLSPYIRLMLLTLYSPSLSNSLTNVWNLLPMFVNFYSLIGALAVAFAWLGKMIWGGSDTLEVFNSLGTALHGMYYITTTNDYPAQFMGIYPLQYASIFYFLLFVMLACFLLSNVLFAVVFEAYKTAEEESQLLKERNRAFLLDKAFARLSSWHEDAGEDNISFGKLKRLIEVIQRNQGVHISEELVDQTLIELDDDGSGFINVGEFDDFCNVLSSGVEVKVVEKSVIELAVPHVANTTHYQKCQAVILHPGFEIGIDVILIINLGFMIYDEVVDLQKTDPKLYKLFQLFDGCFTLVYFLEMCAKISFMSWGKYWGSIRHKYDFFITNLIVITSLYTFFVDLDPETLKSVASLRAVRLCRVLVLLGRINTWRKVGIVLIAMIPKFTEAVALLLWVLYLFSVVGMQLFGGLIYEGNKKLEDTMFHEEDFYANNYNDFIKAMLTSFIPVMVNYTPILTTGYSAVTTVVWGEGFFIFFHIVGVQITVSVFSALIVETFLDTFTQLESEQASAPGARDSAKAGAPAIAKSPASAPAGAPATTKVPATTTD